MSTTLTKQKLIRQIDKQPDLYIDDLIIKTQLNPQQLIQRVSDALIRRRSWFPVNGSFHWVDDNLQIDLSARTAKWYGKTLMISPTQFDILAQLTSNMGHVFIYAELFRSIRGEPISPELARERLKTHVTHLRHKLTQNGDSLIRSSQCGVLN